MATEDTPVIRLTRIQFWACFALSLAVFAFWDGPLWRHPWAADRSVYLSYAVIPPLVAGCLWYRRVLTLKPFALETLEITLWKFAVTYLIANTMWMVTPAPEAPAAAPAEPRPAPLETAAVPTNIPPGTTGIVEGLVTDNTGHGVPGVVIFVEKGLEDDTFAAPAAPFTIAIGRGAIAAPVFTAQAGQSIQARSTDGRLHTLVAKLDGEDLFNIPLQSSGAASSARVPRTRGLTALGCAVHQHSEETGAILVTDNPFFALSDEGGRFRWEGVPAGSLTLALVIGNSRADSAHVEVKARETSSVTLKAPHD